MTEPGQITRQMTLGQALRSVASRFPRRTALVSRDERLTYQQLLERVQALAQSLRELGVGKGDRIAMLLWSDAEFVYLLFAAAELGAVISPLPPRLRRHQMEAFLRELEPVLVVTSTQLEVPDGLDALRALQDELPSLRHVLVTDAPPGAEPGFRAMLATPHADDFVPEQVGPQDLLLILYTSGTTGRAKGVMHSHRGLIVPVLASLKVREMWMVRPDFRLLGRWLRVLRRYGPRLISAASGQQVWLAIMSFHTIAGMEVMLQALLMGDRLVLLPRFQPARVLETIQRERVTVLVGLPMSYTALLRSRDFDRYRLSSLLVCGMGAAPCPPELAREIQRRFRCAVHIGFGLTELGGGISVTSLEDAPSYQAETVGQPMSGMEIRIVDEQRRPLPPGSVGELACRSDGLMLGYFGDQHSQDEVIDEDGWLYTGDLATMDETGYIRIVGRKKDMIIRGGQNVHPARIEDYLLTMDQIREAAVVGVPDELGGESVWAFVIPEAGSHPAEKDILAHCRASLEPYEIPQQIRIVDDFPRTSNGKPQKYRLREIALKELQAHGG
jgi:acyl-CoA synthetase (AMP-forming)/AMP-acid ligase II